MWPFKFFRPRFRNLDTKVLLYMAVWFSLDKYLDDLLFSFFFILLRAWFEVLYLIDTGASLIMWFRFRSEVMIFYVCYWEWLTETYVWFQELGKGGKVKMRKTSLKKRWCIGLWCELLSCEWAFYSHNMTICLSNCFQDNLWHYWTCFP